MVYFVLWSIVIYKFEILIQIDTIYNSRVYNLAQAVECYTHSPEKNLKVDLEKNEAFILR